ncbi:MAG TPA: peptide-methionine (S)-S-oxide reductase MsrA [Ottowia sp.]|jgi:peptide-methionine (S)-S-oxide reductase|nr:peptide-methionine (S)-S-oxide reductase MsrA [Ottowia sp.]HMT83661.1 peptide-methionine (S)-S-oxide reductase MsrA [Ottowia sp.]
MNSSETIVLAGGCFWCTEAVFKQVRGVLDVESGYSNGQATAPTYEQVCTGATGCAEVVKLVYDQAQISTRQILEIFFLVHDPTQLNRQGHDVGTQYRSGIYYSTPEQASLAHELIREMCQDGLHDGAIVTEVAPLAHYFPAEDYHQDFFERNPTQAYCVATAGPKVAKFRQTFRDLVKA